MKIIILGGEVTGLISAYELSNKKHDIIILEKEKFIGSALAST